MHISPPFNFLLHCFCSFDVVPVIPVYINTQISKCEREKAFHKSEFLYGNQVLLGDIQALDSIYRNMKIPGQFSSQNKISINYSFFSITNGFLRHHSVIRPNFIGIIQYYGYEWPSQIWLYTFWTADALYIISSMHSYFSCIFVHLVFSNIGQ